MIINTLISFREKKFAEVSIERKTKFFSQIARYFKTRRIAKKVNRALDITLRKWQIRYIFYNQSMPLFIGLSRGGGKTTAHVLFVLLNPLMGGIELERVFTNPPIQGLRYDPRDYAKVLYGEDGVSPQRQKFFKHEVIKMREKLNAAGIKTNNIKIKA